MSEEYQKDPRMYAGLPPWVVMTFLGMGAEGIGEAVEDGLASTLKPGPFAKESIPASGPKTTPDEQIQINKIGNARGCHACGAKTPGTNNGNWIGDHQLANRLNPLGWSQRLYPHCQSCSWRQGGGVVTFLRRVGKEFKEWYDANARKNARAGKFASFHHRPDA